MLWHMFSVLLALSATTAIYFPEPVYPTLPIVLEDVKNITCREHFRLISEALQNYTTWAYKIWDASSKTDIGILEGNRYDLGHYDECLSINEPFSTQYCLVKMNLNDTHKITKKDILSLKNPYKSIFEEIAAINNDLHYVNKDHIYRGLCFPAACQPADIEESLQNYLLIHGYPHHIEINKEACYTAQDNKFNLTSTDISFCMCVGCILLIILCCSFYHAYYLNHDHNTENKMRRLILCFSVKQNISQLTDTKVSHPSLRILNMIRTILTTTTVIVHGIMNEFGGPIMNSDNVATDIYSPHVLLTYRGDFTVDVFFMMGGLLSTYNYWVQSEKKHVNPIKSVVIRYFRFIPVFGLLSFFYATIFPKLGSGPLWNTFVDSESRNCKENWWTNILTINNYINTDHMCMLQGWYIPCDIHLFICAIILNWIFRKNRKIGLSLICITFALTFIIPFYSTPNDIELFMNVNNTYVLQNFT